MSAIFQVQVCSFCVEHSFPSSAVLGLTLNKLRNRTGDTVLRQLELVRANDERIIQNRKARARKRKPTKRKATKVPDPDPQVCTQQASAVVLTSDDEVVTDYDEIEESRLDATTTSLPLDEDDEEESETDSLEGLSCGQ